MWLQQKKFLCCCPLDSGIVIIGNICILLSFLSIYELNRNGDYRDLITFHGVKSSTLAFIELLGAIILIVVSFILIIGAMKRQQKLIKLWLIVLAVYIILKCTTISTAFFLPDCIILKEPMVAQFFVTLFILSYFWYCVYQFDRELSKKTDLTCYNIITVNKV